MKGRGFRQAKGLGIYELKVVLKFYFAFIVSDAKNIY